jgi:hypothetical protein
MIPDFDIESPNSVGVGITTDTDGTFLMIRLTNEGLIADVYRNNELVATKALMYDDFATEIIAEHKNLWENKHGLR